MDGMEKETLIDGFNKGYLIAKYKREMHEKLSDSLSNYEDSDVFIKGMVEGAKEAELERELGELENLRGKGDERDLGK